MASFTMREPDGRYSSAEPFERSEWEGLRSQPGFRTPGISEPTQWNSSQLEDGPRYTPAFFSCGGLDSSASAAAFVSSFSGLHSTSVDENDVWLPGQRSTFDDAQVPFLQHSNTSCVDGQRSYRASASMDDLAQSRARNLGKRRGECPGVRPGELSIDARLSMMQDSIDKAASKAQAKAQKTHDGHDAPTSPGSPSSRRQEVANIRAMLDADPAIRLCKEGMAERARRNKEKMLHMARHRQHSWSFQGDVGNEADLDSDGHRAPSPFGSSEPPKFCRSAQSFDEEYFMHRKPHKARSRDTKGASAKQFPCSSFENVQAARSRLDQCSNSQDSLNCDRARPMSPTTEFLLSTTFDNLLSFGGANKAKASSGDSPKGSDGLRSPKDAADPFSHEGGMEEMRIVHGADCPLPPGEKELCW